MLKALSTQDTSTNVGKEFKNFTLQTPDNRSSDLLAALQTRSDRFDTQEVLAKSISSSYEVCSSKPRILSSSKQNKMLFTRNRKPKKQLLSNENLIETILNLRSILLKRSMKMMKKSQNSTPLPQERKMAQSMGIRTGQARSMIKRKKSDQSQKIEQLTAPLMSKLLKKISIPTIFCSEILMRSISNGRKCRPANISLCCSCWLLLL